MMLYLLAVIGAGVCLKKFWQWAGSHPEQARQAEIDRQRKLDTIGYYKKDQDSGRKS